MDDPYRLRSEVYLAASEYYPAHGEYIDNSGHYGAAWKECVDAGNDYKYALQALLMYLTSSTPRETHEEAIISTEQLLLSLDYKLKMLQPRDKQPQNSTPHRRPSKPII